MLWCVGHFNLGRVVRFLPYPVIGGFMAGTGWLLFVGGIGVLNPGGINAELLTVDALVQWLPAL
jgi:SulP family sulfate permease